MPPGASSWSIRTYASCATSLASCGFLSLRVKNRTRARLCSENSASIRAAFCLRACVDSVVANCSGDGLKIKKHLGLYTKTPEGLISEMSRHIVVRCDSRRETFAQRVGGRCRGLNRGECLRECRLCR